MSDDNSKFHVKQPSIVSRETKITHITHCPICGGSEFSHHASVPDLSISGESFSIVACVTCGFAMTSPRPTNLDPYYDSKAYVSHSKTKEGAINKLYHLGQKYNLWAKYRLVRKYSTDQKWLDYGCGAGDFLQYTRQRGADISGVEPHSPSRKKLQQLGFLVDTPAVYLETEQPYDAITMWHVLEHVPNLREVMAAHHHRLHPDGVLVVALPNRCSHDACHYKNHWAAYDVPRHLWHFSEKDILALAAQTGFTHLATQGMYLDAFYISMLSEKYRKGAALAGILRGAWSNLQAWFGNHPYSSQIYVFRKNPQKGS